jgi:hypothetical protein
MLAPEIAACNWKTGQEDMDEVKKQLLVHLWQTGGLCHLVLLFQKVRRSKMGNANVRSASMVAHLRESMIKRYAVNR